jgi:bacillithiol synthase
MEPSCVRQTLLPSTTRLFGDYLYAFDKVREFYGYHFSDPEALTAAAQAIEFPDRRREAIVNALREQNGDSPSLAKLAACSPAPLTPSSKPSPQSNSPST